MRVQLRWGSVVLGIVLGTAGCGMGLCVNPGVCTGPLAELDLTPPPPMLVTGETGVDAGEVILHLEFPADTSDYARVEFMAALDTDTAPTDCSSGFLLAEVTSFNDGPWVVPTWRPGTEWSLRVCIYDAAGNVNAEGTVLSVVAHDLEHRFFTSSATFTGNLGGLDGADSNCQALADAATLGGLWRAFLSDGWNNSGQRLSLHGATRFTNGDLAAATPALMRSMQLAAHPLWDEDGNSVGGFQTVWTGSVTSVKQDMFSNFCGNWTIGAAPFTGWSGSTQGAWLDYTSVTYMGCANSFHLYCIEQSYIPPVDSISAEPGAVLGTVHVEIEFPTDTGGYGRVDIRRSALPVPVAICTDGELIRTSVEFADLTFTDTPVSNGRYAYAACVYNPYNELVSSSVTQSATRGHRHEIFVMGNRFVTGALVGGVAGLDALCLSVATGAGLLIPDISAWRAVVSTSTEDVSARLNITGPVYTLANTLVAPSAAALWADGPLVAPSLTEYGLTRNSSAVITGSNNDGSRNLAGGNMCADYTGGGAGSLVAGRSNEVANWLNHTTIPCFLSYVHYYCLSE